MNPLTAVDERLQALEPVARRAVNSLCVPLSVWEDAHAAAMARIWQELDRYDPERFPGRPLEAWVYQRARWGVQDELRRIDHLGGYDRPRRRCVEYIDMADPRFQGLHGMLCSQAGPADVAAAKDLCSHIVGLVSPEQAEVYRLKVRGLSMREIAGLLGVTRNAVYSRTHYARKRLERHSSALTAAT